MNVLKYCGLAALICVALLCVFLGIPLWYFGEEFPLIAIFGISFLSGGIAGMIAYPIVYFR